MKKRLNILLGGGNALIISVLRTFVFSFLCVLSLAATGCSEQNDWQLEQTDSNISRSYVINAEGDTIWLGTSLKADDAWKGEYFYDFDGNLLFTITASGDTIWNDGKEGGR